MSIQINTNSLVAGANFSMRTIQGTGSTIVAGWFKPTPITTGRTLWNLGTTKLSFSGSSGSLSLTMDRGTTDRVVTTGTDATTGSVWNFICVAFTGQSTISEQIWSCTENQLPQLRSLTVVTAGSGNLINSTDLSLGADSANSNDFVGLISQITSICIPQTTHDLALNSEYVYNRYVLPIFLGTFDRKHLASAINSTTAFYPPSNGGMRYIPLDCVNPGGIYNIYEVTFGQIATQPSSPTAQTSSGFDGSFSQDEPSAIRFDGQISNGLFLPPLLRR